MAKHNLTLTRWHKVAERLQQELTRQTTEVEGAYSRNRFDPALKQGLNVQKLVEGARASIEQALALNTRLLTAIATIRTELAKSNAKLGVAERLSTIDSLSKQAKLLETVLAHERDRTVHHEDFLKLEPAAEASAYGQRTTVAVKVLADDRIKALQDEATAKRRRVHGLTDEINDINRSILSIELEDDLAAIAGLGTGE